jgi:cytochrome c oxidase subunit III
MKTSIEDTKPILTVDKWKFMTWLFIITIIMLFASQTSAYLVRRAEGNWKEFEIPTIFFYSTAVLLFSSLFMHMAVKAAKKDNFPKLKLFISLCFSLGVAFLIMQYLGWQNLQTQGVFLKGNPAESFYYMLTGLHGFHLITGLGVLAYSFWAVHTMRVHSKNLIQMEVSATYWHFLDLLWVYLLVFMIYFR